MIFILNSTITVDIFMQKKESDAFVYLFFSNTTSPALRDVGSLELNAAVEEKQRHILDMSPVYCRATQKDDLPFAHIFPPADN